MEALVGYGGSWKLTLLMNYLTRSGSKKLHRRQEVNFLVVRTVTLTYNYSRKMVPTTTLFLRSEFDIHFWVATATSESLWVAQAARGINSIWFDALDAASHIIVFEHSHSRRGIPGSFLCDQISKWFPTQRSCTVDVKYTRYNYRANVGQCSGA